MCLHRRVVAHYTSCGIPATGQRQAPWRLHAIRHGRGGSLGAIRKAPLLSERVHCLVLVGRRSLAVVLSIAATEGEWVRIPRRSAYTPQRGQRMVTARYVYHGVPPCNTVAGQLIRHSRPFEIHPPKSLCKERIAPPPPPLVAGLVLVVLVIWSKRGRESPTSFVPLGAWRQPLCRINEHKMSAARYMKALGVFSYYSPVAWSVHTPSLPDICLCHYSLHTTFPVHIHLPSLFILSSLFLTTQDC